jgi:hypothetical protein
MKNFTRLSVISFFVVLCMIGTITTGCTSKPNTSSSVKQIVDVGGDSTGVSSDASNSGNQSTNSNSSSKLNSINPSSKAGGSTAIKVTPIKLGNINLGGRTIVVQDQNRVATGLTNDKDSQLGKNLQNQIAAIEKKYNIKWKWNTASYDAIIASIAANKPICDIMDIGGPHQLPGFYTSNFLTPLETFPDSINFNDTKYFSITTNGAAINGYHYAVYYKPLGIDAIGDLHVMYFNRTLLEKAGVNVTDMFNAQNNNTWTWDKFEQVCSQIKAAGYTPAGDTGSTFYQELLVSNGSDIFTKTGASATTATFTAGNAAGKAAMNFYLNLYKKGYVVSNTSADSDKSNFIQGKVGFTIDYVNRIYAPDGGYASMKDAYSFIRTPRGPNKSTSVVARNWFFGLAIPTGVKNSEVVADILSAYCEPLLTSSENQQVVTAQLSRYTKDIESKNTLSTLSSNAVYSSIEYFSTLMIGVNGWTSKYVPAIVSGQKTPDSAYAEVSGMYQKSITDLFTKK